MAKNLLCFLGPPASGKGSYSRLALETCQRLGVPLEKIVASDLIKREIKADTAEGREMKRFFDKREHVPAELLTISVFKELDKSWNNCIILDGFPRNVQQCELFEQEHEKRGLSFRLGALLLNLPKEWALKKSSGRLVCPNCDFPYNDAAIDEINWKADMPDQPKCSRTPELAQNCKYPVSLERRENEEIFLKRYALYEETELPVFNHLTRFCKARLIDMKGGYRVMADEIMQDVFEIFDIEDVDPEELKIETHKILDSWEQ